MPAPDDVPGTEMPGTDRPGAEVPGDDVLADLVALRRRLHAAPEVGLHLPTTRATVLDALDGIGLEVTTGRALSSVTAVLRGALPGPTVLLRADMDALPVHESTGLPYAATNGAMHACGHDLHMAGLIGAARMLARERDTLPGTVVFVFQPGEEGHGGARLMLDEGVLDVAGERPVAAYAVHVDCTTPSGQAVTRPGPMMASVGTLHLTVRGSGGHAAYPHLSADPVPVAAQIVLALQTYVARRVPVADPAVVSVTRMSSDSAAGNVLAASVSLEANIRTLSRATLAAVREDLPALARGIAEAHGCTLDAEYVDSYPVTVNDPTEAEHVLAVLDERYGDRTVRLEAPGMASEDFAYFLQEVPGTLVFLGVQPRPDSGVTSGTMHSEHAVFDDALLADHAELLADLARQRLARG